MTTVVNKYCEQYDVSIMRPSIYGNPFIVGKDGDNDQCVALFERYLLKDKWLQKQMLVLKDKKIGCCCKPLKSCHGDVYVDFIDNGIPNEPKRKLNKPITKRQLDIINGIIK
jgi:hypothetical protein